MASPYSSREEFVAKAFAQARPILERRLGAPLPDASTVNLERVDALIDATVHGGPSLNYDPLEIHALRNLRGALVVQKDRKDLPSEAEVSRRSEVVERYKRLLGEEAVHRPAVFHLAEIVRYYKPGRNVVPYLVFCDGGDNAAYQVITRAIAEIVVQPMRINASEELRGPDPVFLLDGGLPRVETEDDIWLHLRRRPRRGLLLRGLRNEGRKVWLIEGVEDLAVDADDEQRDQGRRSFWNYIASLRESTISLHEYEFNDELHHVVPRTVEIASRDVLFLIRTAANRQRLKAWMDPQDWMSLQNSVFEFAPQPA